MRWHLMHEVWERGMAAVIEDAVVRGPRRVPTHLYISVDIDVLDPGFAPGTGTPEPGGLTPADLLRAVRRPGHATPTWWPSTWSRWRRPTTSATTP